MSKEKRKVSSVVSYRDGLSGVELKRYNDKLDLLGGTDPYKITNWSSDVSLLPCITYIDIVNYLLWTPSAYTKEDLKSYKGLEAYNQFVNGWVRDKSAVECNGFIIVSAKVLHSQRMSEKPLRPWIVSEKSGTVKAAHCNCMAGLGEACTHISALLFSIDATVRIRDSKTVTENKAYWLLPSAMKTVQYKEIREIDFTSASSAKRKFERTLDSATSATTPFPQTPRPPSGFNKDRTSEATEEEISAFFGNISKLDYKPVILSIVEPHCEAFIPKAISEDFPKVLTDLRDKQCLTMDYPELVKHCENMADSINCNVEQKNAVELATREQSLSKFWNMFRAGRITASQAKAVCKTNPASPSTSLIKRICYPDSTHFKSAATKWGIENEKSALIKFNSAMIETHDNCSLEESGFLMSIEHPYIGASPDGVFTCDCCGQGTVEVKCPYTLRNETLDNCEYLENGADGRKHLKTSHGYYYQIQTQMGCAGLEFGYFVVWTERELHLEVIPFNQEIWDEITSSGSRLFSTAVLPELVGKFYTRLPTVSVSQLSGSEPTTPKSVLKTSTKNLASTNVNSDSNVHVPKPDLYCYCQTGEHGKMVCCDNENCSFQWFHFPCVGISRKPRGKWFCTNCRKLPQFLKK